MFRQVDAVRSPSRRGRGIVGGSESTPNSEQCALFVTLYPGHSDRISSQDSIRGIPMKALLALPTALLAMGSIAQAADLPQAPPPRAPAYYAPVAPVYNWGGVYIGINGGWGFGTAKFNVGPIGAAPGGVSDSISNNGGFVGGTLGVNFQSGAFVYGVEGDFDASGINTGSSSTACTTTGACQTGNNWLSTLRGRVGFAADRVLFYGTAGGAFGNIQTTFNGVQSTQTQAGWTGGVGVEFALGDNWTAKVEYLYADLGKWSGSCTTTTCLAASATPGTPIPVNVTITDSLVRAGINYKFNF